MALYNIIAKRQQVLNAQGSPVAGGSVFLYEPGTTTFITSYTDSGLVTPHSNPVRLSGSGRANIWISRDCDMRIEDRNGNLILGELNANPDAQAAGESGGLLANGSFEIDTDANLIPDSWVLSSEVGATNQIDTTESTDGAQSFRFTSSGVGGGSIITQDFFPVNAVDQLRVNFDLRSTIATVRNIVRVEWFDISFVSISNSDIYDSILNPVVFATQQLFATPPALARFAKVRMIGIDPSVALAGSTYYDRVSAFYPALVLGVFDNITIQNNDIISTDLNGDINLIPNGTGTVQMPGRAVIGSNHTIDLTDADNALNIGAPDPLLAQHLALDLRTIQSKFNGNLAGNIFINPLGGTVNIGRTTGVTQESVNLNSGGFTAVQVQSAGFLNIKNDGTNDSFPNTVRFMWLSNTIRQQIGATTAGDFEIYNLVNGGGVRLDANNTGGTKRLMFFADADGSVDQYYAGVRRTATAAAGEFQVIANGNLGTDQKFISLRQLDGVERGQLGLLNDSNLYVFNKINSGRVIISGTNFAGTVRTLGSFDPDGATQLYHAGSLALGTFAGGISSLRSVTSTDTENRYLRFDHQNGTLRALIGHVGSSNLFFQNEINSGLLTLQGKSSGGLQRTILQGNPDGGVLFTFAGTGTARTIAAGNGGIEVNNLLTGAGYERAVTSPGDMDSGSYSALTNGLVTEVTTTVEWQRIGQMVHILCFVPSGSATGTSNTLDFQVVGTNSPTQIRPTSTQARGPTGSTLINNGSSVADPFVAVDVVGTFNLYNGTGLANWTNSGVKGFSGLGRFNGISFSYMLT